MGQWECARVLDAAITGRQSREDRRACIILAAHLGIAGRKRRKHRGFAAEAAGGSIARPKGKAPGAHPLGCVPRKACPARRAPPVLPPLAAWPLLRALAAEPALFAQAPSRRVTTPDTIVIGGRRSGRSSPPITRVGTTCKRLLPFRITPRDARPPREGTISRGRVKCCSYHSGKLSLKTRPNG